MEEPKTTAPAEPAPPQPLPSKLPIPEPGHKERIVIGPDPNRIEARLSRGPETVLQADKMLFLC